MYRQTILLPFSVQVPLGSQFPPLKSTRCYLCWLSIISDYKPEIGLLGISREPSLPL